MNAFDIIGRVPDPPALIFISYSRQDREYVDRLSTYLTNLGFAVWNDHDIHAGQQFVAAIQDSIRTCAAMVVVLSPDAVASEWVGIEIAYAQHLKKPVLPLMLKQCVPPITLITTQYEDVTSGRMPAAEFIARLRAISDRPPTPPDPPATLPDDAGFEAVWRRIQSLAGEPFHTKTGLPFTYTIAGRSVVTDRTDHPLHVSQFRLAFDLMPLRGPADINRTVRGPSYIYAILTDPRIV